MRLSFVAIDRMLDGALILAAVVIVVCAWMALRALWAIVVP